MIYIFLIILGLTMFFLPFLLMKQNLFEKFNNVINLNGPINNNNNNNNTINNSKCPFYAVPIKVDYDNNKNSIKKPITTNTVSKYNEPLAYNEDLDNEETANFSDQRTDISQFIKLTGLDDKDNNVICNWENMGNDLYNKILNSEKNNIVGNSVYEYEKII